MVIKHKFISSKSDSSNKTLINPSNWNEEHIVVGDVFPSPLEYNFTAQCFNTPLTANVATQITLSPVPLGVNGSNTDHYLYIFGGSGNPESVRITGGTAISGAESGTIIFTPVNNHSGTWCIESASNGIQEAINAGNKSVYLPAGSYQINSTISIPCQQTIIGAGGNVTTLLCNRADMIVFTNRFKNQGESGCTHRWNMSGFAIDGSSFHTNTIKGFEVIDTHLGGYYQNGTALNFRDICFWNVHWAFWMDRVMSVSIRDIRVTDNTTTWIGSTQGMADSRTYTVLIDGYFHNPNNRPEPFIPKTLADSDALITFEWVLNSRITNFISQSAGRCVGIRLKGLCEEIAINATTIVAASTGIEFVEDAGSGANWCRISDSHIDNLSVAAIDFKGAASFPIIENNEISNNGGSDSAQAIRVGSGVNVGGALIHGNIFQEWGGPTATANEGCIRLSGGSNIQIDGNLFINWTPPYWGIYIDGAVRYSIINNMFWTGGGPATNAINIVGGLERWAVMSNNRYNENDTMMSESRNVMLEVNRCNISREIGNIDGAAGGHVTDRHTSGFNHDGDFRVTYVGGDATPFNGDLAFAGRLLNLQGLKVLGLPVYTFANKPSFSFAMGALIYVTDGSPTDPLTGGGTGCLAVSNTGKWMGIKFGI